MLTCEQHNAQKLSQTTCVQYCIHYLSFLQSKVLGLLMDTLVYQSLLNGRILGLKEVLFTC